MDKGQLLHMKLLRMLINFLVGFIVVIVVANERWRKIANNFLVIIEHSQSYLIEKK